MKVIGKGRKVVKTFLDFIKWILCKLWNCFWIPLKTFFSKTNIVRSILWFLFTVGFSLIGTLINVIKVAVFDIPQANNLQNVSFLDKVCSSLSFDSRAGTFYTFSIVLVASVLYPLFEDFLKHEWHYTHLRIVTIIVAILVLVFGGVFYSFSSINPAPSELSVSSNWHIDWAQFTFVILSVSVAAYSYSIGIMVESKDNHPELDDYADKDTQSSEQMAERAVNDNGDDNIEI